MMLRLTARGFDDLTPAFAGLIPLLDADGARSTVLAQRANVTKQAITSWFVNWRRVAIPSSSPIRPTREPKSFA